MPTTPPFAQRGLRRVILIVRLRRPWYAALWTEAAVLTGDPVAADRIERARCSAADNPVALAAVERSTALARGDRKRMLAAARELRAAGCRYQWARTLVLAGGPERARGEDELAVMCAVPMAVLSLGAVLSNAESPYAPVRGG